MSTLPKLTSDVVPTISSRESLHPPHVLNTPKKNPYVARKTTFRSSNNPYLSLGSGMTHEAPIMISNIEIIYMITKI